MPFELANSLFLSELGVFCGSVVLVDWRVLVSFGPFLADFVLSDGHRVQ